MAQNMAMTPERSQEILSALAAFLHEDDATMNQLESYIHTHCDEIDGPTPNHDNKEHTLHSTTLHLEYQSLLEGALSDFLRRKNITHEEFLAASTFVHEARMKGKPSATSASDMECTEALDIVTDWVVAMSDYSSFLTMLFEAKAQKKTRGIGSA